jgi:hypothetical protein
MNQNVLTSARELVERAKRHGQTGRVAASDELDRLSRDLGANLPDWYRDLLAAVPLIGLELGVSVPDSEPDDETSWLEWLGPGSIHSESLELYPGIAVLQHGFLCVGGCSHGTGDQYFLKTTLGDDPPLVQIDHEIGDDADLILTRGLNEIAPALSAFFAVAKTRWA